MSDNLTDKLLESISPWVTPLGYEVVHLEADPRRKTLRLYIDRIETARAAERGADGEAISIADCVTVTKAIDEPLDQLPLIGELFGEAGYELEVSSPGIDRPLRRPQDFERFKGREIRVHTFRPLSGEELANPAYQSKNPKQKNFLGRLEGLSEGRVRLALNPDGGPAWKSQPPPKGAAKSALKGAKASGKPAAPTNSVEVAIPLPLISKANLEPDFSTVASQKESTE